jgi:hypothetical protein
MKSDVRANAWLQWAGGWPRLLSVDDKNFVVQKATTRPTQFGKPVTGWSIRKPVDHLPQGHCPANEERPRGLAVLTAHRGASFQRTRTWRESVPGLRLRRQAGTDRVRGQRTGRTLAFDEFGPLGYPPDRRFVLS